MDALCKIKYANGKPLEVGNIYSKKEIGVRKRLRRNYVENASIKTYDYVISTGKTHTIKDF